MDNNTTQPDNLNLPQPVVDTQAVETQGAIPITPAAPPTAGAGMPKAQDVDSIEQEWIRAVDALMRGHMENPRQLSQELSKLKARYIKERYNKEIKSSDGQGK